MRAISLLAIILNCFICTAQNSEELIKNESPILIPEFLVGYNMDLKSRFPDIKLRTDYFVSLGKQNYDETKEWAYRLNNPKTGVSVGFTNFGYSEELGYGISIFPFIEFNLFNKLHINSGVGPTYITKIFDPVENANNVRINRYLNWSFKLFFVYDIISSPTADYRIGAGFFHHSNNHTKLPNLGINSVLLSMSAQFDLEPKNETEIISKPTFAKSSQTYFSARFGLGFNALSKTFNYLKPTYTISGSFGKVLNRTFKIGGGFYYRFYQHYYDYIVNDEELVATEYQYFSEDPYKYSTALGVFGNFELLLSHVGIDFAVGFNIYKPFYVIDYKLHKVVETTNEYGETIEMPFPLNYKYDLKKVITGRLGIKYYLFSNNDMPKNNWYLSAHINSNLGEADFPEFSLGYVHQINISD